MSSGLLRFRFDDFFRYRTNEESIGRSILFLIGYLNSQGLLTVLAVEGFAFGSGWLYHSVDVHSLEVARPIFLVVANMSIAFSAADI